MSNFVVWIAIAVVIIAVAAALFRASIRGRKSKDEADPEDNYPLW
jgi:uncharacterized membrane protein